MNKQEMRELKTKLNKLFEIITWRQIDLIEDKPITYTQLSEIRNRVETLLDRVIDKTKPRNLGTIGEQGVNNEWTKHNTYGTKKR